MKYFVFKPTKFMSVEMTELETWPTQFAGFVSSQTDGVKWHNVTELHVKIDSAKYATDIECKAAACQLATRFLEDQEEQIASMKSGIKFVRWNAGQNA